MQQKIDDIITLLSQKTEKEAYQEIIKFGENNKPFPKDQLVDENLVHGCQSRLYLFHTLENGKIEFFIHSDALISKGLAALLTYIYSNEEPKSLFTQPLTVFQNLPILKKISLNRQIGISNLFKKMQLISSKYI
ncbi:MAG: Cysteine desulfuration protein SufE [Chlamydiia bacterium]|nr:Cysteine desulfuration protein SufE [Chlamydiia bacterium]